MVEMSFLEQVSLVQTIGKIYIRTLVSNLCEHYGWETKKSDIKVKNGVVSFSKTFAFEYLTADEINRLHGENRLHGNTKIALTSESLAKIINTSVPIDSITIECSPEELITFLLSSNNKLKDKINYANTELTEEQVDKIKEWLTPSSLSYIYVLTGLDKYKPEEKLEEFITLSASLSDEKVIKRATEAYALVIIG